MVARILKETKDKVVIVSQWTSVLNIVADQLRRKGIHFVELNGKTPIKTRNDIVVSFNQPHTCERVRLNMINRIHFMSIKIFPFIFTF